MTEQDEWVRARFDALASQYASGASAPEAVVAKVRSRRRRRQLALVGASAAAVVAALAVPLSLVGTGGAGVASGNGAAPWKGVIGPDEFVSVVSTRKGITIDLVSAKSGKVEHEVLPRDHGRDRIEDIAKLPGSAFLVTYAHGPVCAGDAAGCFPKPHDCGGEVDRYDPSSGRSTRVWTVDPDTEIWSAVASPDGSEIAAQVAPCATSYFNQYLLVHRLGDGAEWQIGQGEQRCHRLTSPTWVDVSHLVVAFGAARGRPWTGPDGTCTNSADSALAVVDAHHTQPRFPAGRGAAGCDYQAATASGPWIYAVLACGPDYGLHGPAYLERLNRQLTPTRRWSLGKCTDGNDLAANQAGTVLISTYQFCNPAPARQPIAEPKTILDRLDGDRLSHITTRSGVGLLVYSDIAW